MDIREICDLLKRAFLHDDFVYGFLLDGRRVVPDFSQGFDGKFDRLLRAAYRVQRPEDTLRERIGTCVDTVAAMRALLREKGVPCRVWLTTDAARGKAHTVCTFEAEGRTVYLELTPQSSKPWYGREIVYDDAQAFLDACAKAGLTVKDVTDALAPGKRPLFMPGVEEGPALRLVPVTPENWRPDIAVAEAQRRYVAPPMSILARAYAYREQRSRAYILAVGEEPVGMALYYDCPELAAYVFSELFVDRNHQGQGRGEAAARALLDEMAADGRYDRVVLCYIEGNEAARRLYEKLGFRPTGERDGDEIVMEKELR